MPAWRSQTPWPGLDIHVAATPDLGNEIITARDFLLTRAAVAQAILLVRDVHQTTWAADPHELADDRIAHGRGHGLQRVTAYHQVMVSAYQWKPGGIGYQEIDAEPGIFLLGQCDSGVRPVQGRDLHSDSMGQVNLVCTFRLSTKRPLSADWAT